MSEYYRSDCILTIDRLEFDNTDPDWVTIRFKQGKNTVHTVHVSPDEGKKFNFFNKIEFQDNYTLMESIDASNTAKSA
jgi:hypothetical protein